MNRISLTILILILYTGLSFAYSGLIIDATSSVTPVKLTHCTIEPAGAKLDNTVISSDVNDLINNGLLCYTISVDAAKASGFVGDDPLIVRAVYRYDNSNVTDIVIPKEEAEKIVQISENSNYLGNLKIAIIL